MNALQAETQVYLAAHEQDPDADRREELQGLQRRADGTRGELMQLMAGLVPPREVPRVLEHMLNRHSGLKLLKLEGLGPQPMSVGRSGSTAQEQGAAIASGVADGEGPTRLALLDAATQKGAALPSAVAGAVQPSAPASRTTPPRPDTTSAAASVEGGRKAAAFASAAAGEPGLVLPSVPGVELYRHGMTVTFEGGYLAALRYLSALENASWKLFWDAVEVEVQEYPVTRVSITVFSLSTDEAWIGV